MSKKHKKVCGFFNNTEHLLILVSNVTRCVSISAFASLGGSPVGITSSAAGLNLCVITAEIKKYKSITNKKKKKHDKIVLLAKTKLNSVEALIYKVLINSNITHNGFSSINGLKNTMRGYL